MTEILNPNDAFMIGLQVVAVVILLLCGIWWVESRFGREEKRERDLVDRVPMTPEQLAEYEAELDRWLYEGRG